MKKLSKFIYKSDKYYVAECFDVPVVTQGKTLDELIANTKEAIALQFFSHALLGLLLRFRREAY